jgi:hypothetical protein
MPSPTCSTGQEPDRSAAKSPTVKARVAVALAALLAASSVAVAGGASAAGQRDSCAQEKPAHVYSATSMTVTYAVHASPCRSGGARAKLQMSLSVERCPAAGSCTSKHRNATCVLSSGTCRIAIALAHGDPEVASYTVDSQVVATSRYDSMVTARQDDYPTCVSAAGTTRFC